MTRLLLAASAALAVAFAPAAHAGPPSTCLPGCLCLLECSATVDPCDYVQCCYQTTDLRICVLNGTAS
ncbi:MAG TPA: hypothetical protein VF519_12925 [Mycobacteriales bacterium]|jgi:hypothetical protein